MALTSRQERLLRGDFPKGQNRTKSEKNELRKQRQASRASGGQLRVLLIDDDPIFGRLMEVFAAKQGVCLRSAINLEDIGNVADDLFEVAIVDFDLGCVNGVEVAKYLETKIGRVPIVFVSSTDRGEVLASMDLPMPTVFAHKSLGPAKIIDQARLAKMKAEMQTDMAA